LRRRLQEGEIGGRKSGGGRRAGHRGGVPMDWGNTRRMMPWGNESAVNPASGSWPLCPGASQGRHRRARRRVGSEREASASIRRSRLPPSGRRTHAPAGAASMTDCNSL
jgi:hypothetical protein